MQIINSLFVFSPLSLWHCGVSLALELLSVSQSLQTLTLTVSFTYNRYSCCQTWWFTLFFFCYNSDIGLITGCDLLTTKPSFDTWQQGDVDTRWRWLSPSLTILSWCQVSDGDEGGDGLGVRRSGLIYISTSLVNFNYCNASLIIVNKDQQLAIVWKLSIHFFQTKYKVVWHFPSFHYMGSSRITIATENQNRQRKTTEYLPFCFEYITE